MEDNLDWFKRFLCPRRGALSDDARLTSVCLSDVCRVHRAYPAQLVKDYKAGREAT